MSADRPILVTAQLNEKIQPLDRGERYEDPLDAVLKERGIGEVAGGGTLLSRNKEIEYCDLEIRLHVADEKAGAFLVDTLEKLGAPKGSKLIWEDQREPTNFGCNEGMGVYLNGTDLPAEVYSACDVNFVYSEFNRLLDTKGSIHGHWQGPTETALYMYGPSFEEMQKCLSNFIGTYPLCQKARIVQIA
jgi:hypothetical protein